MEFEPKLSVPTSAGSPYSADKVSECKLFKLSNERSIHEENFVN